MRVEDRARKIILDAVKREQDLGTIGRLYGLNLGAVKSYVAGLRVGTLPSREIVRIEIARLQAVRNRKENFFPVAADRYKGLREY